MDDKKLIKKIKKETRMPYLILSTSMAPVSKAPFIQSLSLIQT